MSPGRTPGSSASWRPSARFFSVAYSFRFLAHGFLGPVRDDYPHKPHDPGFGLWAAPACWRSWWCWWACPRTS
jgi:hypothetical protein